MFMLQSYLPAVIFCFITMLCWGSWANTQKLAKKEWRFELFYWDYVIGVLLLSILFAITLGSLGTSGRPFFQDIGQAEFSNILSAMIGGAVFNVANILLVAAIAIAGMSVVFPVGIGIALVLGVILNYKITPIGNPIILFLGVGLVVAAIVLDAAAYKKLPSQAKGVSTKGLVLSVLCGVLMGFFYRFVASSISTDFVNLETGKLSPYTAVFIFSVGVFVSNFIVNTIVMKKPFVGKPVSISQYFKGGLRIHSYGILGGIIWCVGMSFSIIAVASGANARLTKEHIDLAKDKIISAEILILQLETPLDTVKHTAQLASDNGVTVILDPAPAQAQLSMAAEERSEYI